MTSEASWHPWDSVLPLDTPGSHLQRQQRLPFIEQEQCAWHWAGASVEELPMQCGCGYSPAEWGGIREAAAPSVATHRNRSFSDVSQLGPGSRQTEPGRRGEEVVLPGQKPCPPPPGEPPPPLGCVTSAPLPGPDSCPEPRQHFHQGVWKLALAPEREGGGRVAVPRRVAFQRGDPLS